MQSTNRRNFLKSSAAVTAGATAYAVPALAKSKAGANDRIRVAAIGLHRGAAHMVSLLGMAKKGENVELVKMCDCDESTNLWANKYLAKRGVIDKHLPTCQDMRELFDDKSIDAVTIATPDHWHALATIWACQAGKDVFVEKPGPHTVVEGRKMVEAARKYNRMVQHGTQCRSSENIRKGVKLLHEGIIGDIYMARAISYKVHGNLGRHKPTTPPEGLDWDKWLGPAPKQEYSKFRYKRWNWLHDYSNGDIANQPVHQFDIIRWAMKLDTHPVKIQSMGGCLVHDDDREWPDNQTFACQYADGRMVTIEHRNWWTPNEAGFRDKMPCTLSKDTCFGAILLGKKGYMIFPSYTSFHTFLGQKREPGPSAVLAKGEGNWHMVDHIHHPNWIEAIRKRDRNVLTADIEEGHLSSAAPLLGSISHLTGRTLNFDPKAERFVNDDEADKLLSKEYRKPYVVPDQV